MVVNNPNPSRNAGYFLQGTRVGPVDSYDAPAGKAAEAQEAWLME